MRTLQDLASDEFENLTLDLMYRLGLRNTVWRTPGRDGGRDIQGDVFSEDFSGHTNRTSWYVECKRYTDTVSWPVVWEKIAYAESNSADVLLFATTSTLSPQAIDEVQRWNDRRKPPSIRFWGGHDVVRRLALFPPILVKYGLSTEPIRDAAISLMELSKILLKYSNTIASYAEFGLSSHKLVETIQALSELISTKIEQIEELGRVHVANFRSEIDGYDWLKGGQFLERARLDRSATRALLTLLHAGSTTGGVEVNEDAAHRPMLSTHLIPDSLYNDLTIVAFWGNMRLSREPGVITVET